MSRCECCGHDSYYAGVASSGIGPMSFSWCEVCLAMGAEPAFMWECVVFDVEEDQSKQLHLPMTPEQVVAWGGDGPPQGIWFDREMDQYRRLTGEMVPIEGTWKKTGEPFRFEKRADFKLPDQRLRGKVGVTDAPLLRLPSEIRVKDLYDLVQADLAGEDATMGPEDDEDSIRTFRTDRPGARRKTAITDDTLRHEYAAYGAHVVARKLQRKTSRATLKKQRLERKGVYA